MNAAMPRPSVTEAVGGPVRVHAVVMKDVRVVVVDTSTPAITAALVAVEGGPDPSEGGRIDVLAERVTVDARAHGELLSPQIEAALAAAGVRVTEVDAVVAGLGPGPFTGLRVGLVTAAVIGQTRGIPTYGVCSLDGLGARTTGVILVATDARRKEIYWAVYEDGRRRGEPQVAKPADVAALLNGMGVTAAVGDGALRYREVLERWGVRDDCRYPSAAALAELAADRILAKAPSEILTPLYLRRPDAVERQ
jgi:tRNA threonylcarbamoyladenosine biosynthesis protein TsaB